MDAEPEIQSLSHFLNDFNLETDRGAALAAAAYLDERLHEVLQAFMVDDPISQDLLKTNSGPIGSFYTRAAACFALGLLDRDEFRGINAVRKIRNEFGHNWQRMTFETGRVADMCRQLPWYGPKEFEATSNLRTRFNFLVVELLRSLLWRVRYVQQQGRDVGQWATKPSSGPE